MVVSGLLRCKFSLHAEDTVRSLRAPAMLCRFLSNRTRYTHRSAGGHSNSLLTLKTGTVSVTVGGSQEIQHGFYFTRSFQVFLYAVASCGEFRIAAGSRGLRAPHWSTARVDSEAVSLRRTDETLQLQSPESLFGRTLIGWPMIKDPGDDESGTRQRFETVAARRAAWDVTMLPNLNAAL